MSPSSESSQLALEVDGLSCGGLGPWIRRRFVAEDCCFGVGWICSNLGWICLLVG